MEKKIYTIEEQAVILERANISPYKTFKGLLNGLNGKKHNAIIEKAVRYYQSLSVNACKYNFEMCKKERNVNEACFWYKKYKESLIKLELIKSFLIAE